jgi:hypothetical protein
MDAAYEPYVRPPSGEDLSRFPDRSGEGKFHQYGSPSNAGGN